ncbi:MAG: excinuclease ABC subunit UvrC [Candidatus Omnitrophica bacterium]|nr:excinuclease ABC subunit UvrC [Candidatus Omnitrophota bacterium]MDD5351749.1 excinuclease ABC subunit UvrC [Candidatus Omnitrophota bacterium]MDD5550960.1 excinuclease ABC subunit UvrC [Candidatus Omnitrophota bacterium]
MDIKESIKSLPQGPGVYLMKDKQGRVIYVGKAANIKKRVLSYFSRPQPSYKNEVLLRQLYDISTITTASEHEAFLLESRLIKQLRPHYNISLKDDKSFPFIKITRQDYPGIFIGRKKPNEDVEYFGPYTNAKLLRLALKSIRKVFKFCNCYKFPKKECLNFHLGLCSAPCTGRISRRDYIKNIQDFKHFLKRGSLSLTGILEKRMQHYARLKKFEEALKLREKIKALGLLSEQSSSGDWDAIGLDRPPYRIEAFDVSNILGNEAVGSMVTFIGGKPCKNDYRRFRIKIVKNIDDYKMLGEILHRRYNRVIEESLDKPDLIVIDGGRGHLNVASGELRYLGLDIPIIAIAKDQELIYTVTRELPLKLDRHSGVLQLIQQLRDEAHRFAINYHKLLRKKKVFQRDG